MAEHVGVHKGLPETALEPAGERAESALAAALSHDAATRRQAVSDVVQAYPDWSQAWAELGALARDVVEAYADFRVGYHRGLDGLRRAGWRGSGYVRWEHPGNRGFLRCVDGLRGAAASIGETAEEERCALFLRQLDPDWSRSGPGRA